MTVAQVTQMVTDTIQKSTETELELTQDTHLVREIGLSSVEAMLLFSDLEDAFGIDIPVSALRDIETVGDVAQMVIQCLKAQ